MDVVASCRAACHVLPTYPSGPCHVSSLSGRSPSAHDTWACTEHPPRCAHRPAQASRMAGPRCGHLAGSRRPWLSGQALRPARESHAQRRRAPVVGVSAAMAPNDGVRWWEKDAPENMKDLHSTQEFVEALAGADEALVVVEFYASWCGSCRALYPKLCKIAGERPEVKFFKVNFEENKPMCKTLNIRVLPYFHFYRGADGRLDAFSASISKLARLKEAIEMHSTDRCSLGPVLGATELIKEDQAATADAR